MNDNDKEDKSCLSDFNTWAKYVLNQKLTNSKHGLKYMDNLIIS